MLPPEFSQDGQALGEGAERVLCECRSVVIHSPWFRPDVLISQFWHTNDPEFMLSDGADMPTGVCPAYATAIVFMSNLKVVERGSDTEHPLTKLRFTLNPNTFTKRRDLWADPVRFSRHAAVAVEATPTAAASALSTRAFLHVQKIAFRLERKTSRQ